MRHDGDKKKAMKLTKPFLKFSFGGHAGTALKLERDIININKSTKPNIDGIKKNELNFSLLFLF